MGGGTVEETRVHLEFPFSPCHTQMKHFEVSTINEF